MFKKILVPLDGGEFAAGILGAMEPFLTHDTQVELFTAYGEEAEHEATKAHLQEKARALEACGAVVSHSLIQGDPAAKILERIESVEPDLVAMASHGRRGPWRWIRGSVAERVLRHCLVPLLIAQPQPNGEFPAAVQRILVPLDGSKRARAILPLAVAMGRVLSAELLLIRASNAHHLTLAEFVSPVEDRRPIPTAKQLERSLAPARDIVAAEGVPVRCLTAFGDPAAEILQVAEEEGADLIAISTHGRTGLDRWVFGSVAEKVLRAWAGPVLVQRLAADADAS